MNRVDISLSARGVAFLLLCPVAILAAVTVPMELAEEYIRPTSWTVADVFRRFTLNSENSVPAWFSTLLHVCSAGLLAVCAWMHRSRGNRWWKHWASLSVLFCLLSLDEAASFHEILMVPMDVLFKAEGIFYFTWVIPGIAIVCVLGLAYLRFLWNLDVKTRYRFIAAGGIFVGAALGMEMIDGAILDHFGEQHIAYMLATTVEETGEMLGIVIFIWSLVSHLASEAGEIRLKFVPAAA